MSKFICSKLSSDNVYATYKKKGANDLPGIEKKILIKGGAGVANDRIVTPHGVVTEISDEELEFLQKNSPSFNRHVDRGYLKVLTKNPSESDTKKVAGDMEEDESAPLTPEKLKSEGKKDGKEGSTAKK